jgi:hypothetical protein
MCFLKKRRFSFFFVYSGRRWQKKDTGFFFMLAVPVAGGREWV